MNFIALIGSPRKDGNTEVAVDEIIRGLEDNGNTVEKYFIHDLDIHPCIGCERCATEEYCVHDDDAQMIIKKLEKADGLIFGVPIYFGQMNGMAKVMLDRFYCMHNHPYSELSGRAILVFTHAAPDGFYNDYIEMTKRQPFMINTKYVVTDVLDIGYVYNPDDIHTKKDKLEEAYRIGKSL